MLKVVDVVDGDWQARGRDRPRPDQPRRSRTCWSRCRSAPFPMALGVLYDDPAPTFESAVVAQNRQAAPGKTADLQALVAKGQTWQVDKEPHAI